MRRRFAAAGKDIDAGTVDHLLFTCGSLMTGLVPEIAKIAAYARGPKITAADIDAVADPVLDARVFDMTDAVAARDYDKAAECLAELLRMQEEPIRILAALGKDAAAAVHSPAGDRRRQGRAVAEGFVAYEVRLPS